MAMLDSFLLPEGTDTSALPQLSKLGVKLGLPAAYEGASDLEAFENWLGQLIDWFQAYNMDVDALSRFKRCE
jgi:hypothetical protein